METPEHPILQFTKLKRIHQFLLVVSTLEIIMLVFLDYIFLNKLGIDVQDKFLSSWQGFVSNLFTADFFLVLLGFVMMYLIYHLMYPILIMIFASRLLWVVFGLMGFAARLGSGIFYIVTGIWEWFVNLFSKREYEKIPPSPPQTDRGFVIRVLVLTSMVRFAPNEVNKIEKGTNYKWFVEMYLALRDDALFVRLMNVCAFVTALSFILFYFDLQKLGIASVIFGGFFIIVTYLTYVFYFHGLNLAEHIINILSPDELNRNRQQVSE